MNNYVQDVVHSFSSYACSISLQFAFTKVPVTFVYKTMGGWLAAPVQHSAGVHGEPMHVIVAGAAAIALVSPLQSNVVFVSDAPFTLSHVRWRFEQTGGVA
jgi:hypothetical protein